MLQHHGKAGRRKTDTDSHTRIQNTKKRPYPSTSVPGTMLILTWWVVPNNCNCHCLVPYQTNTYISTSAILVPNQFECVCNKSVSDQACHPMELPEILLCSSCCDLMVAAVWLPCCGRMACRSCAVDMITVRMGHCWLEPCRKLVQIKDLEEFRYKGQHLLTLH